MLNIGLDWTRIGLGGLCTLFVLLIFTGQLVPGREMRYWRRAFFEQQRINRAHAQGTQATVDVLRALPDPDREP